MGFVQWFGYAHFFKGLFARNYATHTRSCLKFSIRKITLFLLILSYFGVELSSLNSHVTITYHLVANKKTCEELDGKEAEHRSVSRDLINLKEDTSMMGKWWWWWWWWWWLLVAFGGVFGVSKPGF